MTAEINFVDLANVVEAHTFPNSTRVATARASDVSKVHHLDSRCRRLPGRYVESFSTIRSVGWRLCPECGGAPNEHFAPAAGGAQAFSAFYLLRSVCRDLADSRALPPLTRKVTQARAAIAAASGFGVNSVVVSELSAAADSLEAAILAAGEATVATLLSRCAATWQARPGWSEQMFPPEVDGNDPSIACLRTSDIASIFKTWATTAAEGDLPGARRQVANVIARVVAAGPVEFAQIPERTVLDRHLFPDTRAWLTAEWSTLAAEAAGELISRFEGRYHQLAGMGGEVEVVCTRSVCLPDADSPFPVRDILATFSRRKNLGGSGLELRQMPAAFGVWLPAYSEQNFTLVGPVGSAGNQARIEMLSGLYEPDSSGPYSHLDQVVAAVGVLETSPPPRP